MNLKKLAALSRSELAGNVVWSMCGLGTKVVLQAAYFVIVARALDPAGYGVFAALVAILNILSPFTTCGAGSLMIRATARCQADYPTYIGMGIAVILITGSLALMLAPMLLVFMGWDARLVVVEALVATELLLLPLQQLVAQAFQAHSNMKNAARIHAGASGYRLVAALAFILLPIERDLTVWTCVYAAATLMSTVTALIHLHRTLGLGPLGLGPLRSEFSAGLHFALGVGTQTAYIEADKIMLAQIGGAPAAGIYAAAYRLLDAAFTPIRAILHSAYAAFFKSGASGFRSSIRLAKRLMPVTLTAGALCGGMAYLTAQLVPSILGPNYKDAASALELLAPVIVFRSTYFFLADALSAAGFQFIRNGLQILVAIQSTILNFFLIEEWGWRGAVATCLIADVSLTIYYSLAAVVVLRLARAN
ncbi:MAG: oligosaccharide flippase family protein [Cyanobacteria bacterium]|nr:oligosaccharide flippase family protein [Cyanobacteriota bacterium]